MTPQRLAAALSGLGSVIRHHVGGVAPIDGSGSVDPTILVSAVGTHDGRGGTIKEPTVADGTKVITSNAGAGFTRIDGGTTNDTILVDPAFELAMRMRLRRRRMR